MRGETDLSRLAFVASNFESLQGLYAVPIGVYLLLSNAIRYLGWPAILDVLALACACALQIAARVYYARKFGHVPTRHSKFQWIAPLALLAAWALGIYADQALHASFGGWVLAAWFFVLFCFYRGRIRHYLIPAIVFLVLLIIPGQPYRGEYNWILGGCLIFTGFMDHFVLIRWMAAS
jgi:hypothetical protein